MTFDDKCQTDKLHALSSDIWVIFRVKLERVPEKE